MVDEREDITRGFHKGDRYSDAAHDSIVGKKELMAVKIRMLMMATDPGRGVTSDEAEIALGLSHQSCSARFTQMKKDKELVRVAERLTQHGRMAGAWTLVRLVETHKQTRGLPLFDDLARRPSVEGNQQAPRQSRYSEDDQQGSKAAEP